MSQYGYIKDLAKYGLDNDREHLIQALRELIEYSKSTRKNNFALQLQAILKDALQSPVSENKVIPLKHRLPEHDSQTQEYIIEKLASDYRFENLVCHPSVEEELRYFVREQRSVDMLQRFDLPVANKLLFHGPSGCGKTLASYVMAGELEKTMLVVNLGAIVSSKLGETSRNLSRLFQKAAQEDCILFFDEFDTLGKVRDYQQDHGEMKRVVNTILQLFDYLPQGSVVIAASNHAEMIDPALLRRFDLKLHLDLPTVEQAKRLIEKTLSSGHFSLDRPGRLHHILKKSQGLSYYSIQKSLITAIKRSLFAYPETVSATGGVLNTDLWLELIQKEHDQISKSSISSSE